MHDFVDQQKVINIAIAIILAILAFIVPAAIIYPAKSSFITTQAEEIGTSAWALLTGGIGLLALSGVFLILGVMEKKMKKWSIAAVLSIVACIGLSFSIKDYYYMTPDYFALNEAFSYTTEIYEWDDFASVEEFVTKIDGTTAVEKVVLHMKDGTDYEYDGGMMMRMYATIGSRVERSGGEHIRTKY